MIFGSHSSPTRMGSKRSIAYSTLAPRNSIVVALYALLSGICALSGCESVPITGDVVAANTITVLTVNLRNVYDVPCQARSGKWTNRMDRIATWISARPNKPDIVALQEAVGWVWCPTSPDAVRDYQPMFYLIKQLNSDITLEYRIAYLTGDFAMGLGNCGIDGGATLGGCQMYVGKALLYNARKLVNLTALENGAARPHLDDYRSSIVFRRSLPACNLSSTLPNLINSIDGVAEIEKCSQPTPSAKVWIVNGTASTRLAWRNAPTGRDEIHIYNVHLHDDVASGGDPLDTQKANALIASVEQAHSDNRLYPPLVLGDFNYSPETPPPNVPPLVFGGFDFVGAAGTDPRIAGLIGKQDRFESYFHATISTESVETGGDADANAVWSDHPSLVITLKPL